MAGNDTGTAPIVQGRPRRAVPRPCQISGAAWRARDRRCHRPPGQACRWTPGNVDQNGPWRAPDAPV